MTPKKVLASYEDRLREDTATVFHPVTLPLERRRRRPPGNVLLVDGDPHILDEVGCRLVAWGLSVLCEATASRCLAVLRQEAPDLLLLGRRLRDREGLEILQEVRKVRPGLPVLMIGVSTPEVREEALRRGAMGVLTRPFSAEDLEREVFRALEP